MDKVKMSDIAEKVGVSIAAVSFAINGKPGVSDEMRRVILQAADELGYFKSEREKPQISDGKEHLLILNCSRTAITYDIFPQTPYFKELLRAFEEKLNSEEYHFWIKSLCIDKNFEQNIKTLLSNQPVDGVLLVATDMDEADVRIVQKIESHVVILDACYDRLDANCVVMDNYLGGTLAAQYFIRQGHKRIGYIQSQIRIYNFEKRKLGFIDELRRSGIEVAPEDILEVDSSIEGSYEMLQERAFGGPDRPTCYFAENDYMAIGLLRALQQKGISVPGEIAVIGFDNIDMAAIVTPGLTSINVPKGKLAEICISQLMFMLKHDHFSGIKQFVSVDLVERQSTRKANT